MSRLYAVYSHLNGQSFIEVYGPHPHIIAATSHINDHVSRLLPKVFSTPVGDSNNLYHRWRSASGSKKKAYGSWILKVDLNATTIVANEQ